MGAQTRVLPYPRGMWRARVLALALLAACLPSLAAASSAHASLGPQDSYAYVVDAQSVAVIPQKGTAARIVLAGPAALEFSGLPYPNSRRLSLRALLRALGWSPTTSRFADPAPVASLSISGGRSRVVTLGQARIRQGTLVLEVICVEGPLTPLRGAGALFITTAPVTRGNTPRKPTFPVQIGRTPIASTHSTNVGGTT